MNRVLWVFCVVLLLSGCNITMTSICGACGLGGNPYRDGSYEYYITEKVIDNDPKGVAPFIMAAIELDR